MSIQLQLTQALFHNLKVVNQLPYLHNCNCNVYHYCDRTNGVEISPLFNVNKALQFTIIAACALGCVA